MHRKTTKSKYEIVDAYVDGDAGYIETIDAYCFQSTCVDSKYEKIRGKTWFQFRNGKWLIDAFHSVCDRTEPFNLPEEFNRAISLIIQRFDSSPRAEDKEFSKIFRNIRNCIDIQYASSEIEMRGTEGYFLFSKDSPRDHLQILVSPKYKYKDDLTTSLIVIHELYHALLRSNGEDVFYTCFDNESYAFTISYTYFFLLNKDEQDSLLSRYYAGSSQELTNYFETNKQILDLPGDEKFKDYVKNNEYYINQCK